MSIAIGYLPILLIGRDWLWISAKALVVLSDSARGLSKPLPVSQFHVTPVNMFRLTLCIRVVTMCTTCCNTRKLYIFSTQCIYVF
jgi:hypothetical protein